MFVAAIEACALPGDIARGRRPGLSRVEHPAQAWFRMALGSVVTNREVSDVVRPAYEFRSHRRRWEQQVRARHPFAHASHRPLFKVADEAVFDYAMLGNLGNVGRWMLAKAFGRHG
jgi:hypothetical protein